MAEGAGKYDAALTVARTMCGAKTAALIVFDGDKGPGFSFQTNNLEAAAAVPDVLRHMADGLERDLITKRN